jgi:hypothetical protein
VTLSAPMRCSALAEELGEPMAGTVEHRVRWLLVEDRSAWGADAVADVLGIERAAALKRSGVRALLVRRREGNPAQDAVRRVTLVDTAAAAMVSRRVGSLDELDPDAIAAGPLGEFGDPVLRPILLVCTNGKRDACCAVRGRLVLAALAAFEGAVTLECSHLGGHRFAANVVCLPHGLVYGRVAPDRARTLADAYLRGRVDAALLRGRSAWPAAAQAAEIHVRAQEALDGVDDVGLESAEVEGGTARVVLSVRGSRRELRLRADRAEPPRATSCRADETEAPLHWSVM